MVKCSVCKLDGHNKRNCPNKEALTPGSAKDAVTSPDFGTRKDEPDSVVPAPDFSNSQPTSEGKEDAVENAEEELETQEPTAGEDNGEEAAEGKMETDEGAAEEENGEEEPMAEDVTVEEVQPSGGEDLGVQEGEANVPMTETENEPANVDEEKGTENVEGSGDAQVTEPGQDAAVEANGTAPTSAEEPKPAVPAEPAVDPVQAELDLVTIQPHWIGLPCCRISGLEEGVVIEDIEKALSPHCKVSSIVFENDKKASALVRFEIEGEQDSDAAVAKLKSLLGENPTLTEGGKMFAIDNHHTDSLLFIGNLKYSITDEELKTMFEPHGEVDRAFVLPNADGKSKGYGFVEYRLKAQAAKARSEMGNINMDGRVLRVEWADCREVKDMFSTTLFVDKIPRDIPINKLEVELKKLFGVHGKIKDCHAVVGLHDRPRGFAFIDFAQSIEADKAHQALDNSEWQTNSIRVSFANPTKKPEVYKTRFMPPGSGLVGRAPFPEPARFGAFPGGRHMAPSVLPGRPLARPYGGYGVLPGRGLVGPTVVGGRGPAGLLPGRGGAIRTGYGAQYSHQAQQLAQYGSRYGAVGGIQGQGGAYGQQQQFGRAAQYSPYSRPGMSQGLISQGPQSHASPLAAAQQSRLAPVLGTQPMADSRQDYQRSAAYRQQPQQQQQQQQYPASGGARAAHVAAQGLSSARPSLGARDTAPVVGAGARTQASAAGYAAQKQQQSGLGGYQGSAAHGSQGYRQSAQAQAYGQQQAQAQQQPAAVAQSQYGLSSYQQASRQAAPAQETPVIQQQAYGQTYSQSMHHQAPAQQQPLQQQQQSLGGYHHQAAQQEPSYAQQQQQAAYGQQQQSYAQQAQAQPAAAHAYSSQAAAAYGQDMSQQATAVTAQAQPAAAQQQWSQQQYADYYGQQASAAATAAPAAQQASAVATQQADPYASYYQQQTTQQQPAAAVVPDASGAGGQQSYEAQWAAYYAANPQAAQQQQTQTTTGAAGGYGDYYSQQQQPQQQSAYGTQAAADPAAGGYYQQQGIAGAAADVGQKRPAEYAATQQVGYGGYQQQPQAGGGYDDYTKRARY